MSQRLSFSLAAGIFIISIVGWFFSYKETFEKHRQIALLLSAYGSAPLQLDPQNKIAGCHADGPLPDHNCTPGAIFDAATPDVICINGYSKNVRSVSVGTKQQVYAAYNINYPQPRGNYELDHLIPLELGGSNDEANLFPESAEPPPGFHEKDLVEDYLHEKVCAGQIDLAAAQKQIATNWLAVYNLLTPDEIQQLKQKYKSWTNK